MNFFTFTKLWRALLLAVVLAVGAVWLSGCAEDEDGGGIVGDWEPFSRSYDGGVRYYDDDEDEKVIISFKSSGAIVITSFIRVGNFWIERTEEEELRWRVNGSTLYIDELYRGAYEEEEAMQYKISGNKLILTNCYYDSEDRRNYCGEETYTKANIANVRKNLGRVYATNPALYGAWVLRGSGGSETIYFGQSYFEGGERYIDAEYGDGYWYTDGSRLVLFDDEDYSLRVTLTYSVSGSGNNRTLKIDNDTWIFDPDYYYSPAKSKQPRPARSLLSGVFAGH